MAINENDYVKEYNKEVLRRIPANYRIFKEKKPYWEMSDSEFESIVNDGADYPTRPSIGVVDGSYR